VDSRVARRSYAVLFNPGRTARDSKCAAARSPAQRVGLVAMRERVSAIGGTLQIDRAWATGTEISSEIPLEGSDANTNRARG